MLTRGAKKASEEEACDGEALLKLEQAKGFDRDDQKRAGVEDDLRGEGKEVGAGVFKKGTFRITFGVGLVGKEV